MSGMRHVNIEIRGVVYADAEAAAQELGVTATTIRAHNRANTLDRVGLGQNGPPPMPVKVRGHLFASPAACAAHFKISIEQVYRRLAAGTPDQIGLNNQRGMHEAKPVTIGPLRFRSLAEASRSLGFNKNYAGAALRRRSKGMCENLLAAALREAVRREARGPDHV